MIERKDIVNLNFLKKEACTGSYQGMRYKIELVEKQLIVSIWAGPYCSDVTPDEKKQFKEFEANEQNLDLVVDWLNEEYLNQEETWKQVTY